MLNNKKLRLFLIFSFLLSFSATPSFSLTESVDIFGRINSVDLVLNDIWIEPKNPKNGEKITVYGSLYNAGIIQTGDVSDAITIGYIVNGDISEITLLENVLPGIENGVEISSGPIFDAVDGNHIVTVIVNYHDTLSHLRDNPDNNIVQKIFQIGTSSPSLITSEVYQHYDTDSNRQQVKIQGDITNIFQDKLENKEIIIDVKDNSQKKIITDNEGKFFFETDIPFKNELIEITTSLEESSLLSNQSQFIFPIKLNNEQSALALEIISDTSEDIFEEHTLTAVIFQDSYDNLLKEISTSKQDKQGLIIENFLMTSLPANHEYIVEIYMDGRILDAFQSYFPNNTTIKKEVIISESAQVQFKITDEIGEPQKNIIVDNWIYSTSSNKEGFTDWIKVIPTFIENEPYVAKATFPNGVVVWSEPFEIEEDERKVIKIVRRDS